MQNFFVVLALFLAIIATQANAQPQPGDSSDIIWEVQPPLAIYFGTVSISPDNRFVAVNSNGPVGDSVQVRLYNFSDGSVYKVFNGESSSKFSKDGSIFITNFNDTIILRNTTNYEIIKKIVTNGLGFKSFGVFDITADNKYIVSACREKAVKIFDINTGLLYKTINKFPVDPNFGGPPYALNVEFNKDGTKLFFSGHWSFYYDLEKDSILKIFDGTYPKFSPDNIHLVNRWQNTDGPPYHYEMNIYDLTNTTPLFTIPMSKSTFDFCFSPDGKYIVTGSSSTDKKNIEIWDVNTGQKKYTYIIPSHGYLSVAWSNDGNYISTVAADLYLLRQELTPVQEENKLEPTIYPNPTTGTVKIDFNLQKAEIIILRITDNTGAIINTINLGMLESGNNNYSYNTSRLSVGVYYITLQSASFKQTFKLVKE